MNFSVKRMNQIVIESYDSHQRETERERERETAMKKKKGGKKVATDQKYTQWKSLIPVLYDWITSDYLHWPTLSCRWGPQIGSSLYMNRYRLYLSEQTDGTLPNTLVVANCDVVKARVAPAEHLAQFNNQLRSPFIKQCKTIIHPGEVNRIRELWQNNNIVATHTDCPEVLIWDLEAQPDRQSVMGACTSRTDLVLTGHTDNAEFALAMSPTEPFVLSGGKDKSVVLWSIHDHISTLAAEAGSNSKQGSLAAKYGKKAIESPSVGPRGIYKGHTDTVEDVQFSPSSAQEFCSVGDDSCLMFWDARVGYTPVHKVENAHRGDIHCVDWNPHNTDLLLTGSADTTVQLYDRRKLGSGGGGCHVSLCQGHDAAVLGVQWCPDRPLTFGSCGEDGILNIWDLDKIHEPSSHLNGRKAPAGLLFRHVGHRDGVVDFHWNHHDPWTIVSVSHDSESISGGGTLQIWRMLDLIYRSESDVVDELRNIAQPPCRRVKK